MKRIKVSQSCQTVYDPMGCRLPGSSVHGIFQATVLEWVAISFSRGSSQPRDQTHVSHIVDRLFTIWATREVIIYIYNLPSSFGFPSHLGHHRVLSSLCYIVGSLSLSVLYIVMYICQSQSPSSSSFRALITILSSLHFLKKKCVHRRKSSK